MPEDLEEAGIIGPPEIDKEELLSASGIMQAIVKTIKAFRMYLPNNPLHQNFFNQLKEQLQSHLEEYGDFQLDIRQFSIDYKNNSIYENDDAKSSLAFRINSDGINSITIMEDVENDEIYALLDVISQEQQDTDDDIVTQLWSKSLSHITYVVSDESDEEYDGEGIGTGSNTSDAQEEGMKEAQQQAPPPEDMPAPEPISGSIIKLTEDEMDWLQKIKEEEENKKPVNDVVNILTSILRSREDQSIFEDFLDVTVNLIGDLLHEGEVTYSLGLIKFLIKLENEADISGERKNAIINARLKLLSDEMFTDIEKVINETEKIKPEQLKELILIFGSNAVKPVCKLLGTTAKKEMRKIIIESLVEIGRNNSDDFIEFLKDSRWYLVRNGVLILRLIASPESFKPVCKLISHSEPRVRKEVFYYLQESSNKESNKYILRFLKDASSALRMRSLKTFIALKYHSALEPILSITKNPDFDEKAMSEKKVFFEAIGELGKNKVLPFLSETLTKKFWLNKSKEKDYASCAIAGLRRIKSKEAIEVLKEARESKKGDIVEMIDQALKAVSGK